jgi:hypothetical protein
VLTDLRAGRLDGTINSLEEEITIVRRIAAME